MIAAKVDERRRPPVELAEHDAYDTLGLDPLSGDRVPGLKAIRQLAHFCERYQVQRLWGQPQLGDAPWAGVSPEALHMRSAKGFQEHRNIMPVVLRT